MSKIFWTNTDTGEVEVVQFDATTSEDPTDSVTITDHPVEQGANVVDHARSEPERITIEGYISNTVHFGNVGVDDSAGISFDISAAARGTAPETSFSLDAAARGPAAQINVHLDVPNPPIQISESGLIQAGAQAIGNALFGGPNHTATALSGTTPAASLSVTAKAPSGVTPEVRLRRTANNVQANEKDRVREAYDKLLAAMNARALVAVVAESREYFDMLIERVGKPRVSGDGTAVKFQVDLRRLRIAESKSVTAPQPTEARGAARVNLGSQSVKPDPNAEKKESVLHGLAK